jgi:hypothetical protein
MDPSFGDWDLPTLLAGIAAGPLFATTPSASAKTRCLKKQYLKNKCLAFSISYVMLISYGR